MCLITPGAAHESGRAKGRSGPVRIPKIVVEMSCPRCGSVLTWIPSYVPMTMRRVTIPKVMAEHDC